MPKWTTIIWQQFGAAIDMLENAINACPVALQFDRSRQPEFWYLAYHAFFWLDFYLSESAEKFNPPHPFTLTELDPAGIFPERPYNKKELKTYLEHGRQKCRQTLETLTDEKATRRWTHETLDISMGELLLYNMRHVQHHAAQLNVILREVTQSAPHWVRKTKSI